MSFESILDFTLLHEDSHYKTNPKVTHDPNDPGGTTKYGISRRAHPTVDIENLTLEQATSIYQKEYWDLVAREVDDKLDMASFDTAVNCGVHSVLLWLPPCRNWQDMVARRRKHYALIVAAHPEEEKYADGWENRTKDLENFLS
jgi:hypothetical protein